MFYYFITFDFLDIELEFLNVFIYDLYILFLALENAYGKKAMMYGYISPFSLLIYKEVYKIILTIIFLIIFIPIMITVEKDFLADIEYFDTNKLFLIIIGFFSKFFKNLFNWILVDRFSPSHLALSLILENLSYFISYIIDYGGNDDGNIPIWEICIRIFIYFVLFIISNNKMGIW